MDFFFVGRNKAQEAKKEFHTHFQTGLSNTKDIQDADKTTTPLVTRKRRQAIMEIEGKAIQDYYFNYGKRQTIAKVVCQ